jgi:hypothetical protein
LFFDLFGVVQPFYSPLIIDAKDNRPAARVCQCDYLGYNLFRIDEPDLELEVSVFSAANRLAGRSIQNVRGSARSVSGTKSARYRG